MNYFHHRSLTQNLEEHYQECLNYTSYLEVEKKIEKVRKENKYKPTVVVKKRSKVQFHIGDHVRLFDGKAVGTIDSLEKNKAIVNYGSFTTQVNPAELELVKRE